MPKLIISGTAHELVEEVITIGRAHENTIHIDDPSVSSRHAELRALNKSYRLRDLGSTNGTHVNGRVTRETVLHHGDGIRFGAVQARFETETTMPSIQPLPAAEKVEAQPARTSTRPADFANASPFRARAKERDRSRNVLMLAVAISALAMLAALAAVFNMHAPLP